MVLNRKLDGFVAVTGTITVVGNPHSVLLLSGFMEFQRSEARLHEKNYKKLYVIVHYYGLRRENT